MIVRQLNPRQFEDFHKALMEKAHAEPLNASYTVGMNIKSRYSRKATAKWRFYRPCGSAAAKAARILN